MKTALEKAGFVDVQEKVYKKWPIGSWPKDPILKEAGRLHYHQLISGMEGWGMFFLTKYGVPKPWSVEEVRVLMAKVRAEIQNPRHHFYQVARVIILLGRVVTDFCGATVTWSLRLATYAKMKKSPFESAVLYERAMSSEKGQLIVGFLIFFGPST